MSVLFSLATTSAWAASAEETLFQQRCGACHSLEAEDAKMGPALRTVAGRKAGSLPGYNYSDGMKAAVSPDGVGRFSAITR